MAAAQPEQIKPVVSLLDFDPHNPRFYDSASGGANDADAMKRMLEQENLEELVSSIGTQGFFAGEPLLVTPNPDTTGRYIVVEGNRRLAALRVLGGQVPAGQLTGTLADLADRAKHKPIAVECFLFPRRQDVLKYLGFRHISGPRRWEPLSKARYLADLIRNFYQELDQEAQLKAVASDIGSRRDYVAQLLTALNLYDRAKEKKFYGLQRVGADDINFSLLSTALSYRNIVDFLSLPSREVVDVSSVNDEHAKELLGWMFAQDQRGETVLGESRRLKTLAAVVGSETAVAELRCSGDLDKAYIFSSGPGETFTQLLSAAEANLAQCIGLLGGDVTPDKSHVALLRRIEDKASNLSLLIGKAMSKKDARARAAEGGDDA